MQACYGGSVLLSKKHCHLTRGIHRLVQLSFLFLFHWINLAIGRAPEVNKKLLLGYVFGPSLLLCKLYFAGSQNEVKLLS